MKKVLRWSLLSLLGLIILVVVAGLIMHQPRPEGRASNAADALARRMGRAVGQTAWEQTRWVSWEFRTGTRYLWDKDRQLVDVRWGNTRVFLHIPSGEGLVFRDDAPVTEAEQREELLDKARRSFVNDGFWLSAPFKAFDPGTERAIISQDDGSKALLVTYREGGFTPGDAYLWLLGDDGRPYAWRMWVDISPVGGLKFTWEGWQTHGEGVKISTRHEGPLFSVTCKNVLLDQEIPAIRAGNDPFADLAPQISAVD